MADSNLTFDLLARDRASATFKKVGRNVDDTGKKFTGLSSRLGLFSRIGPRALTVFSTGLAAVGIGAAVMGTKTAASLEQADIAFTTLLGSGKRAQAFLGDLKKFAAKTPFELPGLIDASRQLIGVGENAKDVIPTLTAWGDAAGALGLGQEQFNRVMLAVTQSMGKGKLQAEELMQITEAGVPIWPMLAKALHKPIPELQKLSSQGKLAAEDVFPKLEKQMEKDYGGSMAKQSKTLTGIWSTLMDTINLGLADTLKPLLPFMKDALSGAITTLSGVFSKLPGVIRTVSPIVGGFVGFLTKTAIPAVADFGRSLAKRFVPIDSIKAGFKSLVTFISDFVAGLQGRSKVGVAELFGFERSDATKLGQTIRDLLSTGIADGVAGLDWARIGASFATLLLNAIKAIARSIGKITSAFMDILGKIDWFKVGTEVSKTAIVFAVGFATGFINNVLDPSLWIGLLANHWREVLFAVITVVFTPGKIITKVASVLRKIPFVGTFLAWLLESFAKISKSAVRVVARFLTRLFGAFAKGLLGEGRTRMLQDVWAWLSLIPQRVREFIPVAQKWMRNLIGKMAGAIEGAAGRVGSAIRAVIRRIVNPFARAGNWLYQRGRDIIQGLTGGIWNAIKGIGGWIKARVVDPIVNAVKRFFGIKSPSTVFRGIGSNLVKGLVQGLAVHNGAAIARKVFGSMPKALAAIVNKGLVAIESLPGRALKALSSVASFLGGAIPSGGNAIVALGQQLAALQGWTGAQWKALYNLWQGESGWNPLAKNPTSSAFGIPQFLDSTAAQYGVLGVTDPAKQILAGMKYIADVYGNPANAYAAWSSRSPHWYQAGTSFVPQTGLYGLHRGEAVIPASRNHEGTITINGGVHVHGVQDVNGLIAEIQRYANRNGGIKVRTFA